MILIFSDRALLPVDGLYRKLNGLKADVFEYHQGKDVNLPKKFQACLTLVSGITSHYFFNKKIVSELSHDDRKTFIRLIKEQAKKEKN
jgi:hypothetical protein